MDTYFRKTRRPVAEPIKKDTLVNAPIKRPPPEPARKRPKIGVHPQEIINNKLFKSETLPPPTPLIKTKERIKSIERTKTTQTSDKITSGPLAGISTSLLDKIRAKEAAAKVAVSPEELRERELLGIVPKIARIVPTIFIANKRDVLPYDKVVEKCVKGLKSNYTSETIVECLDLMDRIAPEWVSIVNISRGKFIRFNKDKYNIPQLLSAILTFKKRKEIK